MAWLLSIWSASASSSLDLNVDILVDLVSLDDIGALDLIA